MSPYLLPILFGVLSLAQRVAGHGAMLNPMSRQMVMYQYNQTEEPHGLGRGGGTIHVSLNNTLLWPQGHHTICGDAPGDTRLSTPGKVVATYEAGAVMDVSWFITTNHLGRFNMRLCSLGAASEAECSAPLLRADGKGTWWWLPNRGAMKYAGTGDAFDYDDGSYVMTQFGNWSSWCNASVSCNCYQADGCKMFARYSVFTTRWRLPASGPFSSCKHCILRSYWLTGHTCVPPCTRDHPLYPNCNVGVGQDYCGARLDAYPEEYWGCADVRVLGGADGDTVVSSSVERMGNGTSHA